VEQAVLNGATWPVCGCPLVSSKVTCLANVLLRYKACDQNIRSFSALPLATLLLHNRVTSCPA
jgi:hypothetical protein